MSDTDCTRRQQLAQSKIFGGLAERTLQHLAIGTTERILKRGNIVFGRGTPATGIHVVVSGQLKLCIETPEGDEHVVELLNEGDSCGEAAMLTNRLHLLTAAAITDACILHIARATIEAELEQDHDLARRLIRNLSDRLYTRTSDLEVVLYRNAISRVARFLVDRMVEDGEVTTKSLRLPARKGLIASRLNMSQEHFSRTLRELSNRGHISVEGSEVAVHDLRALRQLAA